MSTTPPPPDTAAAGNSGEWRNQVLQSYRNDEVKEIAKVLAELEPGATTNSKLMLAMKFEDSIFKSASSLEDYRKIIAKRLKKLKKNYKAPAADANKNKANIEEQLLQELKTKYTSAIEYIALNASKAVDDIKNRLGEDQATRLQQHTDSAIQWGKDLGIIDDNGHPISSSSSSSSSAGAISTGTTSASASAGKATSKLDLSEEKLRRLQQHLEKRLENIRQYVVKHADPDLFLQETLERKDKDLPQRASNLLSINIRKRIQQIQQVENFDGMTVLQESLDKAQTAVPLPTRNDANETRRALLQLEKVRASSQAFMAYFSIADRQQTAPRQALQKAHDIAMEGMKFCKELGDKRDSKKKVGLTLRDAWTKTLELPSSEAATTTAVEGAAAPIKKPKWDHVQPVTKSRVLLKPKRKAPSNLLPALRRKQAKLVRPAPDGYGTHLIMEFENVFVMTIYFSPLLVTIRAIENNNEENDRDGTSTSSLSFTPSTTSHGGAACAPWTPLYHGLPGNRNLEVWGVTGTYNTIGHAVEERLRDASNHATQILRKCFRNHVKDKTLEFEIEILEASALLEFLHLARTTYMPDWQDLDV